MASVFIVLASACMCVCACVFYQRVAAGGCTRKHTSMDVHEYECVTCL